MSALALQMDDVIAAIERESDILTWEHGYGRSAGPWLATALIDSTVAMWQPVGDKWMAYRYPDTDDLLTKPIPSFDEAQALTTDAITIPAKDREFSSAPRVIGLQIIAAVRRYERELLDRLTEPWLDALADHYGFDHRQFRDALRLSRGSGRDPIYDGPEYLPSLIPAVLEKVHGGGSVIVELSAPRRRGGEWRATVKNYRGWEGVGRTSWRAQQGLACVILRDVCPECCAILEDGYGHGDRNCSRISAEERVDLEVFDREHPPCPECRLRDGQHFATCKTGKAALAAAAREAH